VRFTTPFELNNRREQCAVGFQLCDERRGAIGRAVKATRNRVDSATRKMRSGRVLRTIQRVIVDRARRTMPYERATAGFVAIGSIVRCLLFGTGMACCLRVRMDCRYAADGRLTGDMHARHAVNTGLRYQHLQQQKYGNRCTHYGLR